MLFGRPLRAETSRSGSASPDDRNADNSCAECTTDFTRYGSRVGGLGVALMVGGFKSSVFGSGASLRSKIMDLRFALRNAPSFSGAGP